MGKGKTILVLLFMLLGIYLILDSTKESKRTITFVSEKVETLIGAILVTLSGFLLWTYKV